jgi:cell division protease FtsH
MAKRASNLTRRWLAGLALLAAALLGLGVAVLNANRGPVVHAVGYGDLVQTLGVSRDAVHVRFDKVQVGHSDVRGEVITHDRVSTGDDETKSDTHKISFRTMRLGFERDTELYPLLRDGAGVYKGGEEESVYGPIVNLFVTTIVFVLIGVGLVFLLRWGMGGKSPFTFGRSRHRLREKDGDEVTFRDVAGIDEAVAELREVVDFLRNADKYQALGGRIPRGVLLIGPPGTGKTLLARAVAGEAEVPFFSLSGSDFVEMFVGVGASRVRDLFEQAEAKAPCIVFIDELDALGKTRSGNVSGGHDEREQTLNQLLVEMDGFETDRGVILMAATNRPETLDPALLRPGRFDRTVVVDRPDINGREAILKVHARHVRLGADVDLRRVAALTPGTAGADLANFINEAALMAARVGKEQVGMADLEEAIERGAVGLERKSRIMHADEKRRVAYHEAGHALVACSLPNTHPVHKISIIPRGVGALGYVLSRPDEDRYLVTQSELESRIQVALGGTLAEELVYAEISNGATSDLEQVNDIARRMVKQFGMSRLGRVCFQEENGPGFLGGGMDGPRGYSEQTAREIDVEIRGIIDTATERVRGILRTRREALEAIAKRLIEKEVIDARELQQLLEGATLGAEATANGVSHAG